MLRRHVPHREVLPESASAAEIAAAVQEVRSGATYADAARLGERIRAAEGNRVIADMIEATVDTG